MQRPPQPPTGAKIPPPPLPPGWTAQWDAVAGRHAFIENATGRQQYNFPGALPAPVGRSPGRHMAHASISGPISPPPATPIFQPTRLGGGGGPPPAGMRMGGHRASASISHLPPTFSNNHNGASSNHLAQARQSSPQPNPTSPPLPLGAPTPDTLRASSPAAAPGPRRPGGKRQYAANTAAYIQGDLASSGGASGGHGRSASMAQPMMGGQPTFEPSSLFTPGIPEFAGGQSQGQPQGQQPMHPQQQQPAGYGYGQQPQAAAGLTNQFGQMGITGGKQLNAITTTNLVNLPLNPAELFNLSPPEINLPPNASFSQSETRNSDPSYQRMTINAIPTTNTLLNKSKVPLALVITPYRSLKAGDEKVPVVADTVIARCRRCRTYINPYVTFIEGGQRWKCCMCNLSNEVPQLFDWDQEKNQPADRYARAELNSAVVEFVAPTEYMVRPPQPPIYIFIIDVSYSAINSGMVATAARTLLESLDRIPNDDNRTKISIIAVDSCLHFFSLTAGSPEPSMLVVGDLDDVFLPKPNDILVNLVDAKAAIESLLGRLSEMFKETHNVGNALGAALQAAYKLISNVGGKVITLSASLPNIGPGALKNREDTKILGTNKESTLLQAATSFYKSFAIECSRSQVSVDMWLFSSAYTDVATLSGLPRYTGGQTYFYPSFNASRSEDALKFAHEFGTVIADPICLEAVMRVRASKGIRMSAFHGNFFVRSTDLLSLAAVPMDQSYAIEIQIEDPISAPFVVFQTAVLHTTAYGERRIRVITLALPTTSSLSDLYANVDTIGLATLLVNKAIERCNQAKLEDARDAVMNKLVDIYGTYKATMTSSGSGASPQLVSAENMKFLPLLMLGLLKHIGLRQSSQVPSDLRAYAQALLTTLPSQMLIPYLHPVFYSLHNMPKECGTIGDHGVILPQPLPLSSERLERHGLFLIEDSQNIFLWVGRDAVPQLVMDVFNIPSYADLRSGKSTLPLLENSFSERVSAIVGKVREARRGPYYPHLYIVKEDGEPSLRQWALSLLIEDRVEQLPSYNQFITQLKDKINDKSF